MKRQSTFYRTRGGNCPVERFLDSLPDMHARKVVWVLRLVENLERVPEHYLKRLVGTQDLWEVRVRVGGMNYRILAFFDGQGHLILTGGFAKKQRKTPSREINVAETRRRDYLQRRGNL